LAEINWTQEAQTWLKDIYRYIAVDDPKAAVRTIRGIYQKANYSNSIPKLGTSMTLKILGLFASFFTATTA